MHTPAADYVLFWVCAGLSVAGYTWLFAAFAVIGGMEKKTLRRVLTALLLGPLLLRNRGFTR